MKRQNLNNNNTQSWGRFLVEAVRSYTKQNNIKFELFSGDWIMRLEKDGIIRYLFGNDFGLNNTATRAMANDKSACYQALAREGVPALEHRILLRPFSQGAPADTYTLAMQAFTDFNESVICKPNNGSSGSNIIFIKSKNQLQSTLDDLFTQYRAITISPFMSIANEYRVCILSDVVELIYEKTRQDDELQHNLSHGAQAKDVTDKRLLGDLKNIAKKTAKALNADFVHVDVIDIAGKLMVLEVNSGIMFEYYSTQSEKNKAKAINIYHKALDILFS